MGRELLERRKLEFKEIVIREKRLPRVWEFKFSDGEDVRLWFNKCSKLQSFKSFVEDINNILSGYNIKVLGDKEKEIEFLSCIGKINMIPQKGNCYFSDNDEMYMWYRTYIIKNKDFETIVHNSLKEYQEFDLTTIWPDVRKEFFDVIKGFKRIPNHGEAKLQNDIDVRTIYDKLKTFDPEIVEKLLLHLETYNPKGLTTDDRIREITEVVTRLRYIPYLQECRFSDGTDMCTWYTKYKEKLPEFRKEIESLVESESPYKKVNIYLIPNFRKTGGKFYTICSNVGERLDLSQIETVEELLEKYPTVVKKGGLILKQDEEIGSVSFKKGKSK